MTHGLLNRLKQHNSDIIRLGLGGNKTKKWNHEHSESHSYREISVSMKMTSNTSRRYIDSTIPFSFFLLYFLHPNCELVDSQTNEVVSRISHIC